MLNRTQLMKKPLAIGLLILVSVTGCLETQSSKGQLVEETVQDNSAPATNPNQVISLSGLILPAKEMSDRTREQREEQLEEARKRYESQPDSLENIIF